MRYRKIRVLALVLAVALTSACGSENSASSANNIENQTDETTEVQVLAPLTNYVDDDEFALADQWPSCDDTALARVMRKAQDGNPITIACIGGSITQGTIAAGSMDSTVDNTEPYANIFARWWKERFPSTEVTFINAGIGGTDSYLGLHRVAQDVLAYEPDLVLVEYAVNDASDNFYKRTYENLLRKILLSDSQPAVMLLYMAQTNGATAQGNQVLVGFHYELPMISYANCIKAMMEKEHFTAKDLSGDEVHPSKLGHAITGELLWKYLNNVYEIKDQYEDPVAFTIDPLTDDRYLEAKILDAASIEPDSLGSFCEEKSSDYFPNGWVCKEGDGELKFTLSFRNLGLLYLATTDGKSGIYDIWVDGECVWSINADFSGGWGNAITAKEIYSSKESAEHKVIIKKSPESKADMIKVLGLLIS